MAETNCISNPDEVRDFPTPTGVAVRSSWREATVSDHFVQFYRDDDALAESVAGFIGAGLRVVEGGIIIATPEHRRAIAQRLDAQGLDLVAVVRRNQFLSLDAQATLALFMVDGMPDEKLFLRTVGHVVTRMLSAGFRVRAFGEMVALLYAQDNRPAAARLEELWNELARTRRFSLFCAYPMAQFPQGSRDPGFQCVCSAHAAVIPPAGSST